MHWLLTESWHDRLRIVLDKIDGLDMEARAGDHTPLVVEKVGNTAVIPIRGVLLDKPNPFFELFDIESTVYSEIATAIHEADHDIHVDAIQLNVDTPGGQAGNEIIKASDAIFDARKPITAKVDGMAASAGYWLASQADRIEAAGPATAVGSIGVAVDMWVHPERVSIASTDAPRKRPDVTTGAGREDVRVFLDQLHDVFVDHVARGRGVSADMVNANFGRGGLMIATHGVIAGMVDSVEGTATEARATLDAMDLDTLWNDHPELYEQVVQLERDRVEAHLMLADASGLHADARGWISDGTESDDAIVTSAHLAASMTNNQIAARGGDSPDDIRATEGSGGSTKDDDARAMFADLGVSL